MKKLLLFISFTALLFINMEAQKKDSSNTTKNAKRNGIGIKAGLNFANVTNVSSINGSSQTGFHAGLFFGSFNKSIIGFRTELMYSRQGYGYSSDSSKGAIKLDYITFSQLLAINVTRYVQIQVGAQIGYLLHAANNTESTGIASADKIISFYNRLDYGFGGGVEIHPIGGFLIGARYNISLSNLYKESSFTDPNNNSSSVPYNSGINFKNNVVQIFVGYRF